MTSSNSMPGSPLTEEVRKTLIRLLANGCSRQMAARIVDINLAALNDHLRREPQFLDDVLRAERSLEIEALQRICEAGKDPRHWRANAWLLEHYAPDRFGKRRGGRYSAAEVRALVTHCRDRVAAGLPPERRAVLSRLAEVIDVAARAK